jgi:phosphatidylserine/phosphatidylglycerophosphate/cardiolipin synthase-like enzyme
VTTRADAQKWFLQWSSATYGFSGTDGLPWGKNTYIAKRQGKNPPEDPWDEGCTVVPLIGGYETLCMIAETLEQAITAAGAITGSGDKGHVYITDWRLNPLRDMSSANPWKTSKWTDTQIAAADQTAIGLMLKLMQAGVNVRVLVWLPVVTMRAKGMAPHIDEHFYLAEIIAAEATRLGVPGRGVVGLDSRVADNYTATHHQKMCVIRVGTVNVAFVGGVDWAFTRRDAPANPTATGGYHYDATKVADLTQPPPQFLDGDWQSGTDVPVPFDPATPAYHRWPNQSVVHYEAATDPSPPGKSASDLPGDVYGATQQIWHDQHFKLTGPIVRTIEEQFVERWMDAGDLHELGPYGSRHWFGDQVIFSQKAAAYDGNGITALTQPAAAAQTGSSYVQMWRTIPLRSHRKSGTLSGGEFTIMAGVANAVCKAEQLIWLFDQYFFSRPLARLLNAQLKDTSRPNLHVVVILPPFADDNPLDLNHLRQLALNDLVAGLQTGSQLYDRVAVYNTWHPGRKQGIYVHAKAKMFDDMLIAIGSGNLNRRSFTCDTELDCAVLDSAVLDLHQKRLWKCLFSTTAWPLSTPRTGNWGKTLFDKIRNTVPSTPTAGFFLIKDPWDTETFTSQTRQVTHEDAKGVSRTETVTTITVTPPTVPTQPPKTREQSYREDYRTTANAGTRIELAGQKDHEMPIIDLNGFIEPSSLDLAIEASTSGKAGDPAPAGRLDEIVYLVEGVAGKNKSFPFRKR